MDYPWDYNSSVARLTRRQFFASEMHFKVRLIFTASTHLYNLLA